jgi:hypothetical protein
MESDSESGTPHDINDSPRRPISPRSSITIDQIRSRASSSSSKFSEDVSRDSFLPNYKVSDHKPQRRRVKYSTDMNVIHYHGITLPMAASQGNLPLFCLLWGMAKARRVPLMTSDAKGNNHLHNAVEADNTDV